MSNNRLPSLPVKHILWLTLLTTTGVQASGAEAIGAALGAFLYTMHVLMLLAGMALAIPEFIWSKITSPIKRALSTSIAALLLGVGISWLFFTTQYSPQSVRNTFVYPAILYPAMGVSVLVTLSASALGSVLIHLVAKLGQRILWVTGVLLGLLGLGLAFGIISGIILGIDPQRLARTVAASVATTMAAILLTGYLLCVGLAQLLHFWVGLAPLLHVNKLDWERTARRNWLRLSSLRPLIWDNRNTTWRLLLVGVANYLCALVLLQALSAIGLDLMPRVLGGGIRVALWWLDELFVRWNLPSLGQTYRYILEACPDCMPALWLSGCAVLAVAACGCCLGRRISPAIWIPLVLIWVLPVVVTTTKQYTIWTGFAR